MGIITSNPVSENRLGAFIIDHRTIEREPYLIMRIMGRCIILETKPHLYNNSCEYLAFSPDFDECSHGGMHNTYNIDVWEDEEGKKLFKFIKVKEEELLKFRAITY